MTPKVEVKRSNASSGKPSPIDHVVSRIAPQLGETCLDVATGTGWTARRIKRRGANVIGIDIGVGVIEAAKKLDPDIDFRVGDAEQLDFPNEAFDLLTSTFGVQFVAHPEDAARELARVCKRGGRLGMCTWPRGDTVEALFKIIRQYVPSLPVTPPPSPFEWGKPERVRELLGDAFDLKFEKGVTTLRLATGKAIWDLFVEGFGPLKAVAAACDDKRRKELEREFIVYHDRFRGDLGIAMPREYLVIVGIRH
jgi:SAM-dependent methyltransferase